MNTPGVIVLIADEPTVHTPRISIGQVAHAVVLMTADDPYDELTIHRPGWAVPAAVLCGFLGIAALSVAATASSVAFISLIAVIVICLADGVHLAAMIVGLMSIIHLLGFVLYLPGRHRVLVGLVLGLMSVASVGVGYAAGFGDEIITVVVVIVLTHGAAVGGLQLIYRSERLPSPGRWRAKHLRNQQCPHCLYDIRNLPEPRCPECGGPL